MSEWQKLLITIRSAARDLDKPLITGWLKGLNALNKEVSGGGGGGDDDLPTWLASSEHCILGEEVPFHLTNIHY